MRVDDVRKVGIIGCGTMGCTMAAAMALKHEIVVKLREGGKTSPEQGFQSIAACFPVMVRKGAIDEGQKDACLSRVVMTTEYAPLADCQVVIDVTPDEFELKTAILQELNKVCSPETIFTNTTPMLSTNALARKSGRPDRYVGSHYCIPVHLMAGVEVVRGFETSDATWEVYIDWLKNIGKVPIIVKKDWPGMLIDWLLFPFLFSAIKAVELGLATVEDVDNACKLGLGHAMGPLELADRSGLDATADTVPLLQKALNDDRFGIPPLLRNLADAGYTGIESGKGFYVWENGKKIRPAM